MYVHLISIEPAQTNSLITNTTQNSITQDIEITKTLEVYEEAKENLRKVEEFSNHNLK